MESSHRITIEQNVEYLKRYAFLEKACMRTLAGWLPGAPEWQAKNQFGLHIWESAEAADEIRGRLRELRNYHPERYISPGLETIAKELDFAQNTAEVIAGVYLVVKKALLQAYRSHPDTTWKEFDNPTVMVTEHLVEVTARQVDWAESFMISIRDRYPGWGAWQEYLSGLLDADGGLSGMGKPLAGPPCPEPRRLRLPWMECQRMPGWPVFDPQQDIQPDRLQDPGGYRLWRFKHYLNEITAAETLGSILWMTPEMPWDFQHNVARHLWDEVRHSQLGQTRVQQLGLKIEQVPQVVQIYNVMMTLPAVEQYALLTTVIEPNGMPEKKTNREHWEHIEDEISAAAVSYDWSDENFHIRWGKQWTPVLLEKYGYDETPEEIKERMSAWMVENTPVKMQQKHAAGEF